MSSTENYSTKMQTIIAIICITVIEGLALMKGVNGISFTFSISAIAGLGGFKIGRLTQRYKNEKEKKNNLWG